MKKLAWIAVWCAAVAPGAAWGQQMELVRVSRGLGGVEANGESRAPAVSEDGRWVAFRSLASNLVAGDTNGVGDIFLFDRTSSTTTLVSASAAGGPSNGESFAPSLSANGRYVAFFSAASNLVGGDYNGWKDVFVRDTVLGTTVLASCSTSNALGNAESDTCSLSLDGRLLVFRSAANNLVAGDTNGRLDIFLRDLSTGTTTLISRSSSGLLANGNSHAPAISGDGRFVAFGSDATNLVSGDTNATRDIFLRELSSSTTTRVSMGRSLVQANGPSTRPSISRDGRWIAFESEANNLATGDIGSIVDIFLVTNNLDTLKQVTRGNGASGDAALSRDGGSLSFVSAANNLVPGDTNARTDIFTYDLRTETLRIESGLPDGAQGDGDSSAPKVAYTAGVVAFASAATNLAPGDTNAVGDVFCAVRELAPNAEVALPSGLDVTDACMASGDFDGDGFDELFLGCPFAVGPTGSPEGAVLIFRGTATGMESQPAWTLHGGQPGARFGFALASAVDTDNDCRQDLLVGAPAYDNGELDEGAVFFYRGRPASTPITGPDEMREGDEAAAEYGYSVSFKRRAFIPAYLVLDALDTFDWLVGAPGHAGGRGRVDGFVGLTPSDRLGTVVLGLGLDQCSYWPGLFGQSPPTYFVASAPGRRVAGSTVGAVVFFNSYVQPWGTVHSESEVASFIGSQPDSGFGRALSVGPDLDGDGVSEVIASNPEYSISGIENCGRVSALSLGVEIAHAVGHHKDARLGRELANAGDLDGDGALESIATVELSAGPLASVGSLVIEWSGSDGYSRQVAISEPERSDRIREVGGAGRLRSAAWVLRGPDSQPRLESHRGTQRSEPCKPFLTETFGYGPGQGYFSCDPNDAPYSQSFALVNPGHTPVTWEVVSSSLDPSISWGLAPSGIQPGRSVGYFSAGTGAAIGFTCDVCSGGVQPISMLLDGVQQDATLAYSDWTLCYDLVVAPAMITLDCLPGLESALINIRNPECRPVPWQIDWSATVLPPGISITPDSGTLNSEESADVVVAMDCNVATTGQYFSIKFQYPCYYGIEAWVDVQMGSCVTTYCTPGASVGGCLPTISGTGIPAEPQSSTGAQYQPFTVRMSGLPGQRAGLIFYGLSQVAWPWAANSNSTLCVSYPVMRLGLDQSGGTAGACDGSMGVDMNAFLRSHPGTLGSPFQVGQTLFFQGWYRDPTAPKDTNLSNALSVTLCR